MKHQYTIAFLLLYIFTSDVYGQTIDNLKNPKFKRVNEAYGYILGQEYSLALINKKFPVFEMNVLKAQMSFNSNFGKSKNGMKKYLSEYFGQNEFKIYEEKLIGEINNLLGRQIFTEEIATHFISEVESRANGNIVSPVLETLLSFQYYDRPHDELTSGFTTTFKTKGHLKSKNTDWQIKIPKSWKAEEAERPNIIQKFTNDYGAGDHSIMLMVKEIPIPKGHNLTKEEIKDLFTVKEMKNLVPEGGNFISFTNMALDNHIGGMLEYEQTTTRLDIKIKIRAVQFLLIRGNKMYMVHCSVSSEMSHSDLSLEINKYMTLYKLVANTIIVNDQYE